MSYLLRHKEGFCDSRGWADVPALLREVKKTYPEFNREILDEIVKNDEKGRYSFDLHQTRIRANQGHSVPVDVELEKMSPPDVLYHGTAQKFLSPIMKEGLTKQNRLHVHLSSTVDMARKVGSRHGKPVILRVDTAAMREDGYEFFRSVNGVWLTDRVPPEYLRIESY